MKDKRVDSERIDAAGATPSNPPLKERELLAAVGKNPYERALLLTQVGGYDEAVPLAGGKETSRS